MNDIKNIETTKVSNENNYSLIISADLQLKINNLIAYAPQSKEWSGVLFYKVEGEFDNKENPLVLTAVDLLLKDLGNGVFTTFKYDAEVATYIAMNDLTDAYLGLIHSHHFMTTSPSDTDMNTVYKEGLDMNHFLSLIVNNTGEYTALLTRRIKVNVIQAELFYNTYKDIKIDLTELAPYTEDYLLEYYYLKIFTEGSIIYDKEVVERIEELKKVSKPQINNNVYFGRGDLFIDADYDDPWYTPKERKPTTNFPAQASNVPSVMKDVFNPNIDELIISLLTTKVILNTVDKKLKYKEFISKTMPSLYLTKFGGDLKAFELFADSWIDLIINVNIPKSFKKTNLAVEIQEKIAKGLLKKLEESKSKDRYIGIYKKVLKENYIYE